MSERRVLVVDDEANMRRVLEIMLSRRGFRTEAAVDGRDALERMAEQPADLVITDLRMPEVNGIELLRQLRAAGNDVPVIVITAHGTLETAVEAMRLGACDYLLRPFDVEALDLAIQRVFASREVLRRNQYLRQEVDRRWTGLVGDGRHMREVQRLVAQVGPTSAAVLISGETGTGKEVVARALHDASPRRDQLFVAINCAALPRDMLESELFGHEKGAFTGALRQRVGKFELAQGGTVFLDEITEMPIDLQAKLLRVLQESEVQRLGGNQTLRIDARILSATNRSPRQAVQDGRLREDLYFRLNVFNIPLPTLRERPEDLPALVEHLMRQSLGPSAPLPEVPAEVMTALQRYRWPGNVRELRNVVERALILGGGRAVELRDLRLEQDAAPPAGPDMAGPEAAANPDLRLDPAVEALESRLITEALRRTGGNKARACALLRISERSLWYKIKKYGLGTPPD